MKRQRRRARLGHRPVIAHSHRAAAGASDVARSGPPSPRPRRVRLWKTLWPQRCIDTRCACRTAPSRRRERAGSGAVSPSRQHMSHRVRGRRPSLPHRCRFRPGRSPFRAPAPTDERLRESSASTAGPPSRGRIRRRDLPRATSVPGAAARALLQRRRVVLGFLQEHGLAAASSHPVGQQPEDAAAVTGVLAVSLLWGTFALLAFSISSPCGPHDESVSPPDLLVLRPRTSIADHTFSAGPPSPPRDAAGWASGCLELSSPARSSWNRRTDCGPGVDRSGLVAARQGNNWDTTET